jgi:hypothetical protein
MNILEQRSRAAIELKAAGGSVTFRGRARIISKA